MYKLILFFLIPFTVMGQTNVKKHNIHYSGNGVPIGNSVSTFPALSLYNTYIDRNTSKVYVYKGGTGAWPEDSGIFPQGQQGPTGATGPQGPIGLIGPKGDNGVCPSCPPSSGGSMTFPYIVVVGTGNDDVAMNQAIQDNRTTNKPIVLVGNITTSTISVAKDNYRLTIQGYGSKWTLRSGTTLLQRTMPTDNSDANIYIIARFVIEGVEFIGNPNAIALDLGASYMSAYRDLKFDSFGEAIHLRFALRTTIQNCEAVNCTNGFIADKGNWSGADNANSQSNQTTFTECRCYMPSNGQVAFGIYAASGCVVQNSVIEGFVTTNAIDFDGQNSNVVKDFTIENVHYECVNGSTNSFIKVRLAGGTVTINKVFGQYGSLFLDAYSTSGLGFVQISNVPWWVGKNGKFFTTSNITLDFKYNEAFRGITSSMWNGTAPGLCGGSGCGYNKYTATDIPR